MGISVLSSLRIESLRLVWLEAFLKVTETENISAAARELGVDQSTVSRYMIALRKWAGRPLLELPTEEDGEEAERLSRTTPAGAELLILIKDLLPKLAAFRDENKQRQKLRNTINVMIDKMVADLNSGKPSLAALSLEDAIIGEVEDCVSLGDGFASLAHMEKVSLSVRRVFAKYEHLLKLEKQAARRAAQPKVRLTSAAHIDMSAYRKPKNEA